MFQARRDRILRLRRRQAVLDRWHRLFDVGRVFVELGREMVESGALEAGRAGADKGSTFSAVQMEERLLSELHSQRQKRQKSEQQWQLVMQQARIGRQRRRNSGLASRRDYS